MTAADTLRTSETLREARVVDRQAAAHARAVEEAAVEAMTELVTRADLEAVEHRLTVALHRALLIQTAAILGVMFALLRLIP